MGYEVIVIKEGYTTKAVDGKYQSCGSITLVTGPKNILVDTGNPWDRDLIITKLKENELSPSNIDYVVCTHGHSDHTGNLNLFTNAVCIVSYDICRGDEYVMHSFDRDIPYEIDSGVEVRATPGHTGADVSLVLTATKRGTVVIAGDLFECEEDLYIPELWKSNSENPALQQANRNKILNIADYIIPGHGKGFSVSETHKPDGRVIPPFADTGSVALDLSVGYSVSEPD